MRPRLRTVAALLIAGCADLPPPGQIVLTIDTDAQLPAAGVRAPLFDTLRIDVYAPGKSTPCSECGRTFGVTAEQIEAHASFGIRMRPHVTGYRVRARLYPRWASLTGEIPTDTAIGPPTNITGFL